MVNNNLYHVDLCIITRNKYIFRSDKYTTEKTDDITNQKVYMFRHDELTYPIVFFNRWIFTTHSLILIFCILDKFDDFIYQRS